MRDPLARNISKWQPDELSFRNKACCFADSKPKQYTLLRFCKIKSNKFSRKRFLVRPRNYLNSFRKKQVATSRMSIYKVNEETAGLTDNVNTLSPVFSVLLKLNEKSLLPFFCRLISSLSAIYLKTVIDTTVCIKRNPCNYRKRVLIHLYKPILYTQISAEVNHSSFDTSFLRFVIRLPLVNLFRFCNGSLCGAECCFLY